MTFWHRLDPPAQMGAACSFGRLVSLRLVEAADVLPKLEAAALEAGYSGDIEGLRLRLWWQLRDSAAEWERRRDRAEWAIRRDLRPLLEANAPFEALLEAADRVNSGAGEPLLWREVRHLVAEAIRGELARRGLLGRRRRHVR